MVEPINFKPVLKREWLHLQDPEWKKAPADQVAASEAMGEIAVVAFVKKHMPSARKITFDFGNGTKQGMFDAVYEYQGRYYIFEAKGGGGRLGTKTISSGKNVQQGTPEYRDAIMEVMTERGSLIRNATGYDGAINSVNKLQLALDTEKADYFLLSQLVDEYGKMTTTIQIKKFE